MRLPSALMTIFILSILSFLAAYGQRYQDVNLEKSSTSKLNEDYELFSKKSATYGRMAVLGGAGE